MITRPFGDAYEVAGWLNPPPLLTYNPTAIHAAWHPLVRPYLRPTPPGPEMIHVPVAAPFGDDPTDASAQTIPRLATAGMIGRLNHLHRSKT